MNDEPGYEGCLELCLQLCLPSQNRTMPIGVRCWPQRKARPKKDRPFEALWRWTYPAVECASPKWLSTANSARIPSDVTQVISPGVASVRA